MACCLFHREALLCGVAFLWSLGFTEASKQIYDTVRIDWFS